MTLKNGIFRKNMLLLNEPIGHLFSFNIFISSLKLITHKLYTQFIHFKQIYIPFQGTSLNLEFYIRNDIRIENCLSNDSKKCQTKRFSKLELTIRMENYSQGINVTNDFSFQR